MKSTIFQDFRSSTVDPITTYEGVTKSKTSGTPSEFDSTFSGAAGDELIAYTLNLNPGVAPAKASGDLTGELDPQAVTGVEVVKIIAKVFKGAIDFMKFVDQILNGPDTPAVSVADVVALNHGLLMDIKEDLEEVKDELDVVLDEIDGLSNQINTNLIAQVTTDAFSLFDMIVDLNNPTNAELNQIVTHGSELMNDALQAAQDVPQSAPAVFIAGQVVPSLMLAVAARVASADYASDDGLGHSSVQNDLAAAGSLLQDIYSPNGILAQRIAEEATVETFQISGFDGNHIFRFAVVQTIEGPGGTVIHNVVGDHTYNWAEQVGSDFPAISNAFGKINGISASEDLDAALAELATMKIDHVVPFDGDHVNELNDAHAWLQSAFDGTIEDLVDADLNKLGAEDLPAYLQDVPSTFGKNEFDAGGGGDDHIVGNEGTGEIVYTAPDLLRGNAGSDTLEGLGERDALFGGSGADWLYGGDDNDKLFGGSAGDRLFGDSGHDKMQGEGGRDTLEGGTGHDVMFQSERGDFFTHQDPDNFNQSASSGGYMYGESGNDLLVGDQGGDNLDGGTGHDSIYGYGGHGGLFGQAGHDLLFAGAGNDTVFGGSGDDEIEGGDGNDEIDGSFGDDTITGGGGDDTITGGYGVDTAIYRGERDDFTVTENADGTWTVTDIRNNPTDGVDLIHDGTAFAQKSGGYGVEYLQFDDETMALAPDVGSDGPKFTIDQNTGGDPPDDPNGFGVTNKMATTGNPPTAPIAIGPVTAVAATEPEPVDDLVF